MNDLPSTEPKHSVWILELALIDCPFHIAVCVYFFVEPPFRFERFWVREGGCIMEDRPVNGEMV